MEPYFYLITLISFFMYTVECKKVQAFLYSVVRKSLANRQFLMFC